MSEDVKGSDWQRRCERALKRVRDAVYEAINALPGPPPGDVVEKIEDVLDQARRELTHKEEAEQCHDEPDETQ